mgnify:CR=1 FL=1
MEEKRLPDLCTKKDTCCGCSACVTICPVCAISMCPDEKTGRNSVWRARTFSCQTVSVLAGDRKSVV